MLSHPSLEESIDKVKSAGCLLYGGGLGAVYAQACCRVSRVQSSGIEAGQCIIVV